MPDGYRPVMPQVRDMDELFGTHTVGPARPLTWSRDISSNVGRLGQLLVIDGFRCRRSRRIHILGGAGPRLSRSKT
jgi:hypothetical protein